MTYDEYLDGIDDSHPMTTSREQICQLCEIVAGQEWRILELGSHAGISTAALAIAAPMSTIVSVDLCDVVPQAIREEYWATLGIENIQSIAADAAWFLRESQLHLESWDFIFHDAVHGEHALSEYLTAAGITERLAIHDFEQLSPSSQGQVADLFAFKSVSIDDKGRRLFVGWQ